MSYLKRIKFIPFVSRKALITKEVTAHRKALVELMLNLLNSVLCLITPSADELVQYSFR